MIPSPQTPLEATINLSGGTGVEESPNSSRLGDCLRHRSGGLRPEPRAASQPFGHSSHIAGEFLVIFALVMLAVMA